VTELFPITLADQIAEVEREVVLRVRVYPRWVALGRLTPGKAERQITVMEEVLKSLYTLKDKK